MPRTIRELQMELRRAGFVPEPGKGSHVGWRHPHLPDKVTLSGRDGDDAKPYQEKQVRAAVSKLRGGNGRQA